MLSWILFKYLMSGNTTIGWLKDGFFWSWSSLALDSAAGERRAVSSGRSQRPSRGGASSRIGESKVEEIFPWLFWEAICFRQKVCNILESALQSSVRCNALFLKLESQVSSNSEVTLPDLKQNELVKTSWYPRPFWLLCLARSTVVYVPSSTNERPFRRLHCKWKTSFPNIRDEIPFQR